MLRSKGYPNIPWYRLVELNNSRGESPLGNTACAFKPKLLISLVSILIGSDDKIKEHNGIIVIG